MSENRRQILEMLAQGKITADEAERLIAAVEKPGDAAAGVPRGEARYIRVLVESEKDDEDAPAKVNIRVPVKLLRAGVKLAGLIPQEARERVNEAMREKGMCFDINQLKPEQLDTLIDGLQDVSIDVDQKNGKARVRVFSE